MVMVNSFIVMDTSILYLLLAYCINASSAASQTTVVATTPVNPVRIGDMFCLHCQVSNKGNGQEITIYRKVNGKIERLVWNEGILDNVDDRVFLAVRQLDDGSVVYFLSVTDVVREDEGEYTCRVIVSETLEEVTEATAAVKVQYFPTEVYPICATSVPSLDVDSGTYVHLNCTSMKGHPTVDITWEEGGELVRSTNQEHGSFISSTASIRLTSANNGAIFVCEIRSRAFPDEVSTCHIGPYIVSGSPGQDDDFNTLHRPTTAIAPIDGSGPRQPGFDGTMNNKDATSKIGQTTKCGQICSNFDESNLLLWRIATVIACGLALIFLIMGITIAVKLSNMTRQNVHITTRTLEPGESRPMYDDLLRRRADEQVYMAIDKASMDKTTAVGIETDHYHTAQIVPGTQPY